MAYLWLTQRFSYFNGNDVPHHSVFVHKLRELLRQSLLRDQVLQLFMFICRRSMIPRCWDKEAGKSVENRGHIGRGAQVLTSIHDYRPRR